MANESGGIIQSSNPTVLAANTDAHLPINIYMYSISKV